MLPKFAFITLVLGFQALPYPSANAQPRANAPEDTVLRQVIVFGRHGVRSPVLSSEKLAKFASNPYPDFGVPPGYLTRHGQQGERLLGRYFRDYLRAEGLLTGNDAEDVRHVYMRSNSIQRSAASAAALGEGLLPDVHLAVHSYPIGTPDPVFDPIAAKIVRVDPTRAVDETFGAFGADGPALAAAYRPELSLIRSALFGPGAVVDAPPDHTDPTALPIPLTANASNIATGNVIDSGAIIATLYAADPFIMEYAEGMPLDQVAWGRLSAATISEQTRIITLQMALEMSTPYLNRLQSSNAAAHVLRSMEQAAFKRRIGGSFGSPDARVLFINSSDAYVVGLASLLRMHWLLPGYQPGYCPPGGSLVFELRQSKRTGRFIVRASFTAQTLDQLRELTPLTLEHPPARMDLLIPAGDGQTGGLDVPFNRFVQLTEAALDLEYVQKPGAETPPDVLREIPMAPE